MLAKLSTARAPGESEKPAGGRTTRGLRVSVGESIQRLARRTLGSKEAASTLSDEELGLIREELLGEESSQYRSSGAGGEDDDGARTCSVAALRALRKALGDQASSSSILQAIRSDGGAMLTAVPPPSAPQSALMAKRRKWLRARQADRKYFELVKDVNGGDPRLAKLHGQNSKRAPTVGQTLREMSHGINLAVGCGTAFTVAYFLAHNSYALFGRRYEHEQALVWGLGAAVLMMVIEISLYILRATRYDSGEDRRRRAREADLTRRAAGGTCTRRASGRSQLRRWGPYRRWPRAATR